MYPKDTEAPPAGVDDMTKLAYLHEPGVLHNLACRFALNEIYVSQVTAWIRHMHWIYLAMPLKADNIDAKKLVVWQSVI